jgi:hypothetical protein
MGRLWELVEGLDTQQANKPTSIPVVSVHSSDEGADQDPRARLVSLLTTWATMDESQWTQEAVDRLKDSILDVYRDHPNDADGWYRAWRKAHPDARLS